MPLLNQENGYIYAPEPKSKKLKALCSLNPNHKGVSESLIIWGLNGPQVKIGYIGYIVELQVLGQGLGVNFTFA